MLDALATERHYVDHLAPVWIALGSPGVFVIPDPSRPNEVDVRELARASARARGISPYTSLPTGKRPVLVASYRDHVLAREQGRRVVVMEHGVGQSYGNSHPSYPGGRDRGDALAFLTPNVHSAGRWLERYPDVPTNIVGSPRLDELPAHEPGPDPVIAVSFHWDCHVRAPWTMSAWGAYRSALPDLAQRFTILGHGHPRMMRWLAPHYRRFGIEVVDDFDEVCRRADLYVCDNSSTLYEFASMARPVVVLNRPGLPRSPEFGLRFWQAATVGVQVDRPADLPGGVERALLDPPALQQARDDALRVVYTYRRYGAERAATAILGRLAA